jgi:hypothetical protein
MLLAGCGDTTRGQISMDQYSSGVAAVDEQEDSDEEEPVTVTDETIYLVISLDTDNRLINLSQTDSARVIQYSYTASTKITDTYGQYMSPDKLTCGRAVIIGDLDSEAKLTSIQLASTPWYQENITRFSIDEEIGMLTIGDTKYQYGTHLRVFAGDQEISIGQVKEGDVLAVQGLDKQILSVQVTRGHGTIALTNTELFEGGWITLGTKIYAKITENMTLEVPVGTYALSVANNGYGDTKEIEVERAQVTTVDLEEYKGEGPKLCQVTFDLNVKGAKLYIDGSPIEGDDAVELRYGVYQLTVIADGYDTWERQLVIHSPEAEIQIGEQELSDTDEDDSSSDETTDGSYIAGDSKTEDDSETVADESKETIADASTGDYDTYLDTLVDLIGSLTGSDSSD